ncbi:MAG: hypothetical protein LV471_06210 [Nitrosomonas sp.]|nr:hypothetical protein [Nitrosomonas sp.]
MVMIDTTSGLNWSGPAVGQFQPVWYDESKHAESANDQFIALLTGGING